MGEGEGEDVCEDEASEFSECFEAGAGLGELDRLRERARGLESGEAWPGLGFCTD